MRGICTIISFSAPATTIEQLLYIDKPQTKEYTVY